MTKNELVSEISESIGITKTGTERIIECMTGIIAREVAEGHKVHLGELGSFGLKVFPERHCFVPATKTYTTSPEKSKVVFKAGTVLRDAVSTKTKEEKTA